MPWNYEPNCVEVQEAERLKYLDEAVIDCLKHGSQPGKRSVRMFYRNNGKEDNVIKNLLMTDDEIDLEKILCLHVLSTIAAPRFCHKYRKSFTANKLTPYSFLLPTFALYDTDESELLCMCWAENDRRKKPGKLGPFRTHFAINERIMGVILIAIDILEETSSEKLQKLAEYSHNLDFIKTCLEKEKNILFMNAIHQSGQLNDTTDLRVETCIAVKSTNRLLYELERPKRNLVFMIKMPNPLTFKQSIYLGDKGLVSIRSNEDVIGSGEKVLNYQHGIHKSCSKFQVLNQQKKTSCKKHRTIGLFNPPFYRWPFPNKLISIDKELQQINKFNQKYMINVQTEDSTKATSSLIQALKASEKSSCNTRNKRKRHFPIGKEKTPKTKHLPKIFPRIRSPSYDQLQFARANESASKVTGWRIDASKSIEIKESEERLISELNLGKIVGYGKIKRSNKTPFQEMNNKNGSEPIRNRKLALEIPSFDNILGKTNEIQKIKNDLKIKRVLQSIDKLKAFRDNIES